MIDEDQLRKRLLDAAAARHPDGEYGKRLRDVAAGRLPLRAFAADPSTGDRLTRGWEQAVLRYRQQGNRDLDDILQRTHPPCDEDFKEQADA